MRGVAQGARFLGTVLAGNSDSHAQGAGPAAVGAVPTPRMPQPDPDTGPRLVDLLPVTGPGPVHVGTGTFQLRAISPISPSRVRLRTTAVFCTLSSGATIFF